MYTEYGTKQIYLVQPTSVDYSIYNNDPIKGINEYTYRTYYTCNVNGCGGGIHTQLNRIKADKFAKLNGLILITDYEQDKLLERYVNDLSCN